MSISTLIKGINDDMATLIKEAEGEDKEVGLGITCNKDLEANIKVIGVRAKETVAKWFTRGKHEKSNLYQSVQGPFSDHANTAGKYMD